MIRKGVLFVGVLALLLFAISTSAFATETYQFVTKWGSQGSGDGQFYYPEGITTDTANVYVTDAGNNRIQGFDSSGTYITQWGSLGTGNGQFRNPYGIITDTANVYVTDAGNNRIQGFDSSGTYITQWGSSGAGSGQLSTPYGIATDSAGNVYVADTYNDRIQKFSSSGTYITQWGSSGTGNGQFSHPRGITTDTAGNVYVADRRNHRIQKFNSNGNFITQWGSYGTGNGQFNTPYGIVTDTAGNVYVSDRNNHRIQKFNSSGTYMTQWSSYGTNNGQLNFPSGITVDTLGNVYVADTYNHRIQKFSRLQYTLSISKLGSGSGLVSATDIDCGVDCSEKYDPDSVITLTAIPDTGSIFAGWSGAGCSGTGICSITMTADTTVTATFIRQYSMSVSKSGAGSGTVTAVGINCGSDCSEVNNSGTIVTLTASADQNSVFAGWSSGTGSAASCTGTGNCSFSINADSTLNTVFALKTYAVTPSAGTGGSISPNTSQTVANGATAAFTVTPSTGYHIATVSGCGGSFSGSTFTTGQITADCTVTTSFAINTYTVTPSAGGNGSMTPASAQTVNHGSTTSFAVMPVVGYHIASVTGCGGILSGFTYTTGQITGDCTVSVIFAINTYTVTPSTGANGSINPNAAQMVNHGSTASFTVMPNTGYHIDSVTGCSGTLSGSTFTTGPITGDCTVMATFAINTYTVTPVAVANGSMSPSAPQAVNYNGTTAFTITPANGYHINTVSGCGGILSGNIFTTGPITADCTVTALFAINTYTVTLSAGANGSISPAASQTVNHGSTTSFVVTPNTGYHINSVSGCNGSLSGDTFTTGPITGDCAVIATFAINTYVVTPLAGSNGAITPNTARIVNHGSTVSITVTPSNGYHIDSVSGCSGLLTGNTYTTGAVIGDCTVSATFAINTYTVTPSAEANGAISPAIQQTVNYNGTTVFTITPANGYHINTVSGCGGTLLGNIFTTGPITVDCTVTALFAINTYTVTPSAGANGSINPNTVQIVNHGSTVSFTVTPDTGYHIVSVGGCNGNLSGNTFTTGSITGDCTVTASLAVNTYTVTPSAGANGSISLATSQTVSHGSMISFIVTPSTGYHIEAVSGCGGSLSGNTYTTGQITGDCTVAASFAINTYTVTPSAVANGSISCTSTLVNYGLSSTCAITPETGYHIVDVAVNGNSMGTMASYTIDNITADTTITATFAINNYTVIPAAGTGGSINPNTNQTVNHGSTATFTVTPNVGHHIVSVSGCDGTLTGNTFTTGAVTGDCNVTATFAINTYVVAALPEANGSINPDAQVINHGSAASFAVTPATGYHIASVTGCNGTLSGNIYTTGPIAGDCTISATFAINTYAVTATAGANGSITCSPTIVNHGSNSECVITPEAGYHIADVTVNGVSVGSVNAHTISNITGNTQISATFEINTYEIAATAGPNGAISCTPNPVNHGSNAICAVTPLSGYHTVNVIVDGKTMGALTTYAFSNVTEVHAIQALFADNHRTAKLRVRIEDRFKEHGKGNGIVTSSDGVINCNGKDRHRDDDDDCTYRYYENTVVVLTATAADRSVFAEWEGCDSADGSTCIVTVSNNTKVEADFDSLDPEISVHPDSLHFGSTRSERPEKRKVKIKNKGDAALVVSSVKVVGSADFTTNWVGQQTLGYKDSYTLEVTFAPKSKGEKTATLRITSNDPEEPVVELPMSGKGNFK